MQGRIWGVPGLQRSKDVNWPWTALCRVWQQRRNCLKPQHHVDLRHRWNRTSWAERMFVRVTFEHFNTDTKSLPLVPLVPDTRIQMVGQRMHEPPQNRLQILTKEKRNWSRQDKLVYLSNLWPRASKLNHEANSRTPGRKPSSLLLLLLYSST